MNYFDILKTVMPYFGVFTLGFCFKYFFISSEKIDKLLFRFFFHFFFTCLIFNFIYGNNKLYDIASSLSLPLWGMLSVVSGFIIAYFSAPLIGLKESVGRRAFAFSVGVYNFGFFTIPIISHLFGRELTGQLLIFNFGIDLVYWTLGIMILTGSFRAGLAKMALSTPFYALFITVILNTLIKPQPLTGEIGSLFHWISVFTMPLGLLVSGMALGEGLRNANFGGVLKIGFFSIFLRFFVMSIIFLLTAKLIDNRSIKIILAVQSSMPAGMLNLAVIRFFMGESKVTSSVIVFTTVVSLLLMPFWLDFAFKFVNIQ